ncbi:MAG: hypothetical protein R3240_04320 [Gammaproteobacteria bacterium]|nr:hypothetical protein [Gammaproteobacteria bacterium]
MKKNSKRFKLLRVTLNALMISGISLALSQLAFADLPDDVQSKIKTYQEKLASWSQDPDIISAIKHMNTQSDTMNNDAWKGLASNDPQVQKYLTSPAGQKLHHWKKEQALGKLFIRDKHGNFVAGSNKPAIYNISDRPPFKNAIKGKAWSAKKIKKDPTTKRQSVQLSYPVVSDGENIGIIHTAIILD